MAEVRRVPAATELRVIADDGQFVGDSRGFERCTYRWAAALIVLVGGYLPGIHGDAAQHTRPSHYIAERQ